MNTPCPACSNGPAGPAGHDALMAVSMGGTCLSLQCETCHSFWQRTSDRKLGFIWRAVDGPGGLDPRAGVAIPPRSTDSVGRPLRVRNDPDFDRFVSTVLGKALGKGRKRP